MGLVNGLPAHVLMVHLAVVLVPTAAALLVAQAWVPSIRRWAGPLVPLLCVASLGIVWLTADAGEWLQDNLPPTPLIEEHAELGDNLLPWTAALAVLSVLLYLWHRRPAPVAETSSDVDRDRQRGVAAVPMLLGVLALAAAAGAGFETFRIGESGARAVWEGATGR